MGLFEGIVALLAQHGAWLVLVVTLVETAIFIGLLVPAEATVLLAAFLAHRGVFQIEHVLAATFFGGLIGDQVGYLLGRFGGSWVVQREGRIGRLWRRHELRAAALFRRHSLVAISLARFISFVRTLMPWFAGMSAIRYRRFLLYDALGVFGWATASVALGYYAGASWRAVSEALGAFSATLLLLGLAVLLLVSRRGRAARAGGGLDHAD
ncbi:MAG: DedA family protein [Longimicrobiales bacterium]